MPRPSYALRSRTTRASRGERSSSQNRSWWQRGPIPRVSLERRSADGRALLPQPRRLRALVPRAGRPSRGLGAVGEPRWGRRGELDAAGLGAASQRRAVSDHLRKLGRADRGRARRGAVMKVRTVVKRLEVTIERDGKRVAQMRMVSGEGAGADLVEAMTSVFIGPPSPEARSEERRVGEES